MKSEPLSFFKYRFNDMLFYNTKHTCKSESKHINLSVLFAGMSLVYVERIEIFKSIQCTDEYMPGSITKLGL